MKPETEIRNLKRQLKLVENRANKAESSARISEDRAYRAEFEAEEWERWFDIVMSKIPDATQ